MSGVGVAQILGESFAPLVDLVYPPRCPLCGDGIERQNGLCGSCWSELVIPGEPGCASCQRPFASGVASSQTVCVPCLENPPRHDGIAAGTLYNDASRKLVLSFKHGGRIALAPMLAGLIRARLPENCTDHLVVPVPLHRWRLWRRGYNQAALLAREIAQETGATLVLDALERKRPTPALGGLGKSARKRALAGALRVAPRHRAALAGARVILVDDVLTSGATSDACVSLLKRAGAKEVVIACFARVLGESTGDGAIADEAGKTKRPRSETPGAT